MNLDGLGINLQSLFLVYEEFLDNIALVSLKLDHVAGLLIIDDGAIASKLLLDDFENLLEIKLGWDSFDSRQRFTTISLLDTNMDVGLDGLLGCISSVLILRIREGIERF